MGPLRVRVISSQHRATFSSQTSKNEPMWRRPTLLGTCLQRLPVFCRTMATQYRRNLINKRKPKPGPPREFQPVDPEQKERKMLKEGANLYDMLSRMPNYGIGYRVFRDSWQMKGCDARVSPVQGVWRPECCRFPLQVATGRVPLARDQSYAQDGEPPPRTQRSHCCPAAHHATALAVQYARQGVGPTGVEGDAFRDQGGRRERLRKDTGRQKARVALDGGLAIAERRRGRRGRSSIVGSGGLELTKHSVS